MLLASDCRATWTFSDGSTSHSDDVQKITHVAPGTAIGFVGDIGVAAKLLYVLFKQLPTRKHQDPESLSVWFPRLFRREFARYAPKRGAKGQVTFIVPCVLGGRPNIVRRTEVAKLFMNAIESKQGMPRFLYHMTVNSEGKEHVEVGDCPYSTFYTMESPDFAPKVANALTSRAFGSGEKLLDLADEFTRPIQLHPDKPGIEMAYLEMALWSVAHSFGESTVGGMFPILKIKKERTEFRGVARRFWPGTPNETVIELVYENERMIQRNRKTGHEVSLKYPWEAKPSGKRFDDFDDEWRKILGRKRSKGS